MISTVALRLHRDTRLLLLLIALIAVGGLSSLSVLPRAEDPRIVNRGGGVVTRLAGADAERIEALVTRPLEEALLELDEVRELKSTSRAGVSVIRIELEDAIGWDDVDQAWSRVRDELTDAEPELPEGATRPNLTYDDFYAMTVIAAVRWDSDTAPSFPMLNRLAEDLEDSLRAVPGTEYTDLFGYTDEQIVVELDQARLTSLGLTAADVARAIAAGDAKVDAGIVRSGQKNMVVEVTGEIDSLERMGSITIRRGVEGDFVTLSQIASITKQVAEPRTNVALSDNAPALVVGARMAPGERVDIWAADARTVIEDFHAQLGPGISASVIFDQSTYTDRRLQSLMRNFALGVGAVMVVIFVLMGWRSAILVGAALPLTVLVVLTLMRLLGIPIHQMSVTGLIIALGLLIDNAIVIVDDIDRAKRSGKGQLDAIRESVGQLAIPLLGSTVTTVLAFLPIVLMPGGAGEFVGDIAMGVILALITSFTLALTVIAALSGRLTGVAHGTLLSKGLTLPSLLPAYQHLLRLTFRAAPLGVAIALLLPVAGFAVQGRLMEQFFPGAERDQFQLQLRLPDGASIEQSLAAVDIAQSSLAQRDLVTNVHWFVGDSAPMFYYNMTGGEDDSPHFASALVQLTAPEIATGEIRAIQDELEALLPGVQVFALQFEQGPPFDAPVELKIYGNDFAQLDALGDHARRILAEVPQVIGSRPTLATDHPLLSVVLDEQSGRLAGLNNTDVASQLSANLEGAFGGSLLEQTEDAPIRVRLAEADRADVDSASTTDLFAPGQVRTAADAVPLSAIASLEIEPSVTSISRINGKRVNRILGFVDAGVLPQAVLADYAQRLETEFVTPPGYSVEFGGEAGERDRAVSNLMASVAVLGVMMVAALVLSFSSFRLAGLILFVAAAVPGLGFLALAAYDLPFGFMGIVGIIGLIGVAINDSIVVLAAIRSDADARKGDIDAIVRVVTGATRHIVATTLTTIAGFTPLLLDGGTFWPPLAIVIAGGVAGATFMALVLIPSAYRILIGAWGIGRVRLPGHASAVSSAEHAHGTAQPATP